MIVVVFRARLRPDADMAALGPLYEEMYGLVSQIPGFLAVKDFTAGDGEAVTIVEFDSMTALEQWKQHPDHLRAKERGRKEF
ncbi:MAG: antibiotic biosynthesis monooxygenase, partial [Planctomycetaceae bacterium]|nr:antibiotic biosynthesis monooxygenase [Planctomycetaceae bacterium]